MDIGNIAIWVVLGLLVAFCVVPMLKMRRHGKHGGGDKKPPSQGGQDGPH